LIETDPIRQRVKHAIAGYSGATLKAYHLDLRGWILRLHAAFLDPLAVEPAHIEFVCPLARIGGQSFLGNRPQAVGDLQLLSLLLPGTTD